MDFCVFEWETIEAQESELMNGESESPREVCWSKVLGRGVRYGDERHVYRELTWWAVLYSVRSCLACQRFDSGSQVFSNNG